MPIDNSTRFPKPLAADLRELSEGMAIVIDGDTAPKAITSGQYLFIKNHSTLATGGYHATAAIASGADITSSNVTPDADGIVNGAFSALSEQIGTLDAKTIIYRSSDRLGNKSIPANSGETWIISPPSVDGYSLIGIIPHISCGLTVSGVNFYDYTKTLFIFNYHTASQNCNPSVLYLYAKN